MSLADLVYFLYGSISVFVPMEISGGPKEYLSTSGGSVLAAAVAILVAA